MTILSPRQQHILSALSTESAVFSHFYLTGGTALAEYYLHHRLSEDLDFFAEEVFEIEAVLIILRKLQPILGYTQVQLEQSFNRNICYLTFPAETLKMEFTYFPFPRIEKKQKIGELFVDSLIDIAVNKLFTIYQKPRSRDFIDLYLIIKKEPFRIDDLIKQAQAKFDHHIDLAQLGTQFLKATELKDYPHMLAPLEAQVWQSYFEEQSKQLSNGFLAR